MPVEWGDKTTFSAVCASKVDELVFFFNQKSEIDDAYWEMHVQQCVFPVTGIFLFSSSNPKGRVKPST